MIYVIAGPTASGKTEIAIALAKKLGCEIISADSRQIYKHLDVGTGKPHGKWELCGSKHVYYVDGIPHHMTDFVEPHELFSAGDYRILAADIIKDIESRGKDVIIAGGTGLYIRALLDGLAQMPPRNDEIRAEIMAEEKEFGRAYLHEKLAGFDPLAASRIHPSNIARVVRAIEVYRLSGKPISEWHRQPAKGLAGKFKFTGIYRDKQTLRGRITSRIGYMLKNGMVTETKYVLEKYGAQKCPAFSALGYRSVISYLEGKITVDVMEQEIIKDTLAYAKRQMTWFRKDARIIWLEPYEPFDPEKMASLIV